MRKLELLAPAKNADIAIIAINNGADAVYMGGPAFGARKAAGNTLEEIERVVRYAHGFYCRVFVTLNTILYDEELPEVERLIHRLYRIGVDAIIVQDPAILKLDLPPIALHASTQMHNYDLERIKFLDQLGFQRIVLARELSVQQLKNLRQEIRAELEYFVHGALCVSLSGQCYMSQYLMGRSANRGECAQACRMRWTVEDDAGKVLVNDKYALSLRDLNLSIHMDHMAEIGIDSFKIEGRLKEADYVANVTNYYSSILDKIVASQEGVSRVGSGHVVSSFEADPARSFNRGFTDYLFGVRERDMVSMDSPKSLGKKVVRVMWIQGNQMGGGYYDDVHNGDGLCYFDGGELRGIKVNSVENYIINSNEKLDVKPGTEVYRNYDHEFVTRLAKEPSKRKINVKIDAYAENEHLKLVATDEDGISVSVLSEERFDPATNPTQAGRITRQLSKSGDSIFDCREVEYHGDTVLFIPVSVVNGYRRKLLDELCQERERQREKWIQEPLNRDVKYTGIADWRLNVVNRLAAEFYREHGVETVEPGFEVSGWREGRAVMTTCYCLLFELGMCRRWKRDMGIKYPLYLSNKLGRFRLEFDCQKCFMSIYPIENGQTGDNCTPPPSF